MQQTSFSDVHEAVRHAGAARELDLSDQGLDALPNEIEKLANLERLDVSANPLGALPDWLAKLGKLQSLNISATGVAQVPEVIASLPALEELTLGGFDGFIDLPPWMRGLVRLCKLALVDANRLTALPDWLGELPALQDLRVVRNRKNLKGLDAAVARMPHLRVLVLEDVPLNALPEQPGTLAGLRELRLSHTHVTRVPGWLGSLDQLEVLRLEENPSLAAIPEQIGALPALRELHVWMERKPIALPESLGKLERLEMLSLVGCELSEVPAWVLELRQLRALNLMNNPLVVLPPGMAHLGALRRLELGYNPNLAGMRDEIAGWLPQCQIKLAGAA